MSAPVRKAEIIRMQRQLAAHNAELSSASPKNGTARELAQRMAVAEKAIAAVLKVWPDDWPQVIDRHSGPVKPKQ